MILQLWFGDVFGVVGVSGGGVSGASNSCGGGGGGVGAGVGGNSFSGAGNGVSGGGGDGEEEKEELGYFHPQTGLASLPEG